MLKLDRPWRDELLYINRNRRRSVQCSVGRGKAKRVCEVETELPGEPRSAGSDACARAFG